MKKLIILFVAASIICIESIPYEHSCGENANYHGCASACSIATCTNPNPARSLHSPCIMVCVPCVCKSGFLRNHQGKCVQPTDCEKV
ncbi:cysteine-rich protease inhibitor [Culex quinquefasciatus]|uniref:Cysteine-rich protease inhibitor n=1 Tax=Culex quinquefasciatus TaxID=7176 RepID=Q6TRY3_CULQU|nr:chymotrypsin inhibitor [Culex quinquefasciatus]AAR18454.1 putative cysteine-rich protease inhibitor [Culex quinquefasciatus]EDS41162.1 cysteine-rich protease inhibitor [Culex quinquefasciatus]|eukprot:XP_001865103.1 cysteine-rich protease inhibitor [Culex quinquefasciatus]